MGFVLQRVKTVVGKDQATGKPRSNTRVHYAKGVNHLGHVTGWTHERDRAAALTAGDVDRVKAHHEGRAHVGRLNFLAGPKDKVAEVFETAPADPVSDPVPAEEPAPAE